MVIPIFNQVGLLRKLASNVTRTFSKGRHILQPKSLHILHLFSDCENL